MATTILNNAQVQMAPLPAGTPIVDLSCFAIALEITPSTEDIDVGVFCAPSLTDQGRTTFTAVLSMLWEPAVYDTLFPHIGKLLLITFSPDKAVTPAKYVKFETRYAAVPWGRFEVGQRVEVELPLAVLTTPVWFTAP